MSSAIVSIDNVRFGYNERDGLVLRDLSLDIPQGSVTALLGPNGSGKTTLLNLCLGWLKPSAGEVRLEGRPLHSIARKQMGRTVSLVPQDEHLPFEYSVLEYVLLGRAPYLTTLQIPDAGHVEAAHRALREIGADQWAERGVTTLSAGEKQLVMTARSLAQQPRLLLMDEPSSHLDLANTARLLDRISALARSGVTVVLTTHDPRVASACATEVALMREGQILFAGPTQQALSAALLSRTYGINVEVHAVGRHRMVTWS